MTAEDRLDLLVLWDEDTDVVGMIEDPSGD